MEKNRFEKFAYMVKQKSADQLREIDQRYIEFSCADPENDNMGISFDLPRWRLQFNKATAVLDSVLPCSTVFNHCLHLSSKLSHLRNIFMGTLSRDDDSKF